MPINIIIAVIHIEIITTTSTTITTVTTITNIHITTNITTITISDATAHMLPWQAEAIPAEFCGRSKVAESCRDLDAEECAPLVTSNSSNNSLNIHSQNSNSRQNTNVVIIVIILLLLFFFRATYLTFHHSGTTPATTVGLGMTDEVGAHNEIIISEAALWSLRCKRFWFKVDG